MNNTSLATGTVSFPLNSWHTLALDFKGTAITALFDNTPLATITDGTYSTGNAGLGAKQWINAQFDNFAVTGQSTSSDAGTAVVDAGSGGSTPVCAAHPPPADANSLSVITAFANVTADAGAGASTWFGSWSTDASVFGGGSYSYPGMGPGTDSLANPAAGNYCTTLASQIPSSLRRLRGLDLLSRAKSPRFPELDSTYIIAWMPRRFTEYSSRSPGTWATSLSQTWVRPISSHSA